MGVIQNAYVTSVVDILLSGVLSLTSATILQ